MADPATGNISIINGTTNQLIGSPVPVGTGSDALAVDSANGDLYVAVAGTDHVAVLALSTDSVVASLPVGASPSALALDPESNSLFVTNSASNNVTVIDTLTNGIRVAGVPVGTFPEGIAFDPVSGALYVSNFASDNISVINGSTDRPVSAIYIVPAGPDGLVYDAGTGELFVASSEANLVSATPVGAPPRYAVSFTESGLSPGTAWSVSLAGTRTTSGTSTINYSESAGTYRYTFGPVAGYRTPFGGNLTVVNQGVAVGVTYVPTTTTATYFPVTFRESGLPNGTEWTVNLSGTVNGSRTSSVGFTESNGTYPFVANATGFTPTGSSGVVVVAGGPQVVNLAFVPVPASFPITFSESGLPNDSSWWVLVGNANASGSSVTITERADNGTWTFRVGVGRPRPARPAATLDGPRRARDPNHRVHLDRGVRTRIPPRSLIAGVGLAVLVLVVLLALWRWGRGRAPDEVDQAEVVDGPWVRPLAQEEGPP